MLQRHGQAARAGAADYSPFTPTGSGRPETKGEIMADSSALVARLLAGPADVELTTRELAFLEAHLANRRRRRFTLREHADGVAERWNQEGLKLGTIRDFNRNLQSASAPPAPTTPPPDQATGNAGSTPPPVKTGQGEGTGGGASVSAPPPEDPAAQKQAVRQLEPADRKAYFTRSYAESKLGTTTDRQAYEWLSDNGLPDERDSPELASALAGYKLPTFATWSKQVRNARHALNKPKYTRRAGRPRGRSIASDREIERQSGDDD